MEEDFVVSHKKALKKKERQQKGFKKEVKTLRRKVVHFYIVMLTFFHSLHIYIYTVYALTECGACSAWRASQIRETQLTLEIERLLKLKDYLRGAVILLIKKTSTTTMRREMKKS